MKNKVKCPECRKLHDGSWELGAWCSDKCLDISSMRVDMTTKTNSNDIKCPYCNETLVSISDDYEEVYEEERRCRYCERLFIYEKEVHISITTTAYPIKEYLENKYKEETK